MLFNSIEFLFFLPIVFLAYWFVFQRNLKFQNIFLLLSSYIFYGWWDWRFLILIIISSFVDFFLGIELGKRKNNRIYFLYLSLISNLGLLGIFKYYNFFIESLEYGFNSIGLNLDFMLLNIILPVGISFYTFQTLSYTIDIYFRRINPTKDIIAFFAFVSFFPQLVAGPIERASNLFNQFTSSRNFIYKNSININKSQ